MMLVSQANESDVAEPAAHPWLAKTVRRFPAQGRSVAISEAILQVYNPAWPS